MDAHRCPVCDKKCGNSTHVACSRRGERCSSCEFLPGRNAYEARRWLEIKRHGDKIERLWGKLGSLRDVTEARQLLDRIEQMTAGLHAEMRAEEDRQGITWAYRAEVARGIAELVPYPESVA
jgi:hypothetical protein